MSLYYFLPVVSFDSQVIKFCQVFRKSIAAKIFNHKVFGSGPVFIFSTIPFGPPLQKGDCRETKETV